MSGDSGNRASRAEPQVAARPQGSGPVEPPYVERFLAGLPPLAIHYGLLCLVSLFVLLLVLVERGFRTGAVLTGLVGVLAVLLRWRPGIALVAACLGGLLAIDGFLAMHHGTWFAAEPWHPANLLLCAAFLAFVICDLRLLGLTRNILPRDHRHEALEEMESEQYRQRSRPPAVPMIRVPDAATSSSEWSQMLATLPIWIILGQLTWLWLREQSTDLSMHDDAWRLIVIFLALAAVLIVVGFVFSQWRYRTMSPLEAMMILQDESWSQTRQDQMLAGRWLAWRRDRRPGKGSR